MKNKTKLIATALILLNLSGCAAIREQRMLEQKNMKICADTVPECSTPEECATLMQNAEVWVTHNSDTRIAISTPSVIETFLRGGHDYFSITKEPLGGGKYFIHFNTGYFMPQTQCVEFNNFVNMK